MAKIYNFEERLKNKVNKLLPENNSKDLDILLSVIKNVYAYIPTKVENPLTDITPWMSTEQLFEGNRYQFARAFVSLIQEWEIGELSEEEIPLNEEFERFVTIEDICLFIDKKVS